MVTILATVTIVSLILTIALSALVIKLLREERRRGAARAAALAQMADSEAAVSGLDGRDDLDNLDGDFDMEPADVALDHFDRVPSSTAPDLFAATEQRSANPWSGRLAIVAVLTIVILAVGAAIRWRMPAAPGTGAASTAATSATSGTGQTGLLELLSLKDSQQANTLTITGLVQNPRDGVQLSKVAATAFLFSADGTFLASGRSPLDFTTLRPGDESGFVINIPVSLPVARYRIGFRDEDGRIIGHVDRRSSSNIAQTTTRRTSDERDGSIPRGRS